MKKKFTTVDRLRILNRLLFFGATRKSIIQKSVGSNTGFKNYTGIGNKKSGINNGDFWPPEMLNRFSPGVFFPIEKYKDSGVTKYRYKKAAVSRGFNLFPPVILNKEKRFSSKECSFIDLLGVDVFRSSFDSEKEFLSVLNSFFTCEATRSLAKNHYKSAIISKERL